MVPSGYPCMDTQRRALDTQRRTLAQENGNQVLPCISAVGLAYWSFSNTFLFILLFCFYHISCAQGLHLSLLSKFTLGKARGNIGSTRDKTQVSLVHVSILHCVQSFQLPFPSPSREVSDSGKSLEFLLVHNTENSGKRIIQVVLHSHTI